MDSFDAALRRLVDDWLMSGWAPLDMIRDLSRESARLATERRYDIREKADEPDQAPELPPLNVRRS
jgi:hypothetical protein